MSNWFGTLFTSEAVDTGLKVVATVADRMGQDTDEEKKSKERDEYIAKWKKEAKATIKAMGEAAKKNYTDFREFIKKYDTAYLGTPIDVAVKMRLKEILKEARTAQDKERSEDRNKVVLALRDIGISVGIDNTNFTRQVERAIEGCFDGLEILYNEFTTICNKEMVKIKETYQDNNDMDEMANRLDNLSSELLKKYGANRERMKHTLESVRTSIRDYTATKMKEMDYKWGEVIERAKQRTDPSTPEEIARIRTDTFKALMPCSLVYFKILASIAGVRSADTPIINPENAKRYGEYGNGFFAVICYNVDQYMDSRVKFIKNAVQSIRQKRSEANDIVKALTM